MVMALTRPSDGGGRGGPENGLKAFGMEVILRKFGGKPSPYAVFLKHDDCEELFYLKPSLPPSLSLARARVHTRTIK